jgi:amino acid transporter
LGCIGWQYRYCFIVSSFVAADDYADHLCSNGGPPGVLYEFIAVSVFYWLVAASLAELASSIPSSAGVYHWASVTPGPRYGRICGYFAGWWNFLAWNFAAGECF